MVGLAILVAVRRLAVVRAAARPDRAALDVTKATGPPLAPPSAEFPLGTDETGRSVLR